MVPTTFEVEPNKNINFDVLIAKVTIQKIVASSLLGYYLFSSFCLPSGNFSALKELPEIYRTCKQTEHADMNLFDFITDHLLNIDGLFDEHAPGDDQKPHQQMPTHLQMLQLSILAQPIKISVPVPLLLRHQSEPPFCFFASNYLSEVFRPPIA